jgi:hypothetical protein
VIRWLLGVELFAENDCGDAVLLKAASRRQLRLSAEERVQARRRAIARVIIPNATQLAAGRSDDDVGAVHRIKIVLRRVVLGRWLRFRRRSWSCMCENWSVRL